MAKKKKKSGFGIFGAKKKKKKTKAQMRAEKEANVKRAKIFAAIFGILFVAAAVVVGFVYLEKYVKNVSPVAEAKGPLEFPLESRPEWFNESLIQLIENTAGGKVFELNEESAKYVGERLEPLAWLKNMTVRTTNDSLVVTADYRKPIAWFKLGNRKYCIDEDLVDMPYLNIAKLQVVEISGSTIRSASNAYAQEDIRAARTLIKLLAKMDKQIKPEPPLLDEIASVDVSNFNGRKHRSTSKPHIIIYLKNENKTPIYWGNALGRTTGLIEATDEDKLAALYNEYKENDNTLLNLKVRHIDLRKPR